MLELDELDAFVLGATNYLACSVNPTRWERCELGRFSFTLAVQALSFAARWRGNDEFWSGWGGGIVSGLEKVDYSYNGWGCDGGGGATFYASVAQANLGCGLSRNDVLGMAAERSRS